jgi:hypothetical protein
LFWFSAEMYEWHPGPTRPLLISRRRTQWIIDTSLILNSSTFFFKTKKWESASVVVVVGVHRLVLFPSSSRISLWTGTDQPAATGEKVGTNIHNTIIIHLSL